MDEEFVSPAVERFEGGWHGDVEAKHAAVGSAVKCHAQALKALLPGRIPDLKWRRRDGKWDGVI